MIGTRLGPYEIRDKLGEGGMGEVYRARDTRLDRDVALKILPALFTSDPDRLARFEREARVLASLNHPNIAHVYGFEQGGDVHAIAMELVEGHDLAEIIRERGGLPLDEALAIARQIATALEAAHEAGIVHRDLKPANVKVRDDGTVKVLDFGLAKAFSPAADAASGSVANSPTLTARATELGMILGTAAYMAPEQARGRAVDRRADVWAFGVVLFEMLTGRPAFTGDDVAATIASVIRDDVAWDALPAGTPAAVRRLLRRCLARKPEDRLHAIADARLELDEAVAGGVEAPPSAAGARRGRPLPMAALAAGVLLIGALAGWFMGSRAGERSSPVRRLAVPTEPISSTQGVLASVAIAPDGSYLTYIGGEPRRLYTRRLDQMESVPLPGTEGATTVFISPDGESIGFVAENQVKVVARSGGAPSVLHTFKDNPEFFFSAGGSWASDGSIYVSGSLDGYGTLWKIAATGGTAERIVPLADERGIRRDDGVPQVLPGGRTLLFSALPGDVYWECRHAGIKALDLLSGEEVTVLDGACFVHYVETGHLVYFAGDNQLSVVPFDATTLQLTGPPRPLPLQVPLRERRAASLATASDGTLVYEMGTAIPGSQLVWLDRDGTDVPALDQPRDVQIARLSPRGDRIAAVIVTPEGIGRIWMYDVARRVLSPISPPGPSYRHLTWTRDGRSLVALRQADGASGVYRISVDGAFAETSIYDPKTPWAAPWDVSPDGRFLAVVVWSLESDKDWDIQIVPVDGSGPPAPFAREGTDEQAPRFSRDGDWLAYSSSRTGRNEVYLKRIPEAGAPIQVSTEGGAFPFWSPDGTTLFYVNEGARRVFSASVDLSGALPVIGTPQSVFDVPAGLEPQGWTQWADSVP